MIRVSDHAVLRFLEHEIGLDIEAVRLELEVSLERVHAAATGIGTADYAIRSNGNTFIVRGDTVTTVMPSASMSPGGRFRALAPRPVAD